MNLFESAMQGYIAGSMWRLKRDLQNLCLPPHYPPQPYSTGVQPPPKPLVLPPPKPQEETMNGNADLIAAGKAMIELFEAWRDAIFRKLGVAWIEEPPAVRAMRTAIAKAEESA